MSKKIQLTIAEPCHENWETMSPTEQGRYCGACQKQVIDFTGMSDRELVMFFKKPSTGTLCGRFMTEQLGREVAIPKKRLPWVKYLLQLALPAMFFSSRAAAQGIISKSTYTSPLAGDTICANTEMPVSKINQNAGRAFKGRVTDVDGEPVSFATINFNNSEKLAQTAEDGSFVLDADKTNEICILVSAAGYIPREMKWKTGELPSEQVEIVLERNDLLQNVTVRSYGYTISRSVVGGAVSVGIPVTNLIDSVKTWLFPPKPVIHLYPNPLVKGQVVTVESVHSVAGGVRLTISDMSGRLLATHSLQAVKGSNRFSIPTNAGWAAGVYFVRIAHHLEERVNSTQFIIR